MKKRATTVKRTVVVGLIGTLVLISFLAGNVTGYLARPALAAEEPEQFSIFWEAWDLVTANFVDRDKIDYTEMTYGAIEGMLASLGDEGHTTFLPSEAVEMHESSLEGSFEGIGAYVSMEENGVTIVAPIAGSPAEAAGILAGDVILAVDGESVEGLSLNEVIAKIRGPADTEVVLTVRHADGSEPVEIPVVRQRIEIDSVNWSVIPGTDVAYLQITQFAADTGQELEVALKEIAETRIDGRAVQGILLDLRNNPGGYLREAIRVGSQFLPKGDIILLEQDADGNTTTYRSHGRGYAREIPLVVLTNEGTASAGEITAGALKENGRAKLIGQTTFGTGTVLNQFTLSDGSAILLGVTNWLTPKGNLIKGQGVAPDVEVEQTVDTPLVDGPALLKMTADDLADVEDEQFLRGLEQLIGPQPTFESASSPAPWYVK